MKRTIESFLNTEVKEYSISVIKERALPCVIDGLKPVQRKILYTASKEAKTFKSTKALVGAVIDKGGYEKGDKSIEDAIVKMVQKFPGANNVPWLEGQGSFGSRFLPDGAADARYTKTRISPNFEQFFTDSELLTYTPQRDDDNFEPNYYLPIIPTILLNGPSGIAVGFDCEFQPYSVVDIIKNIRMNLAGRPGLPMTPTFYGWNGDILIEKETGIYVQFGKMIPVNGTTLKITEIPTGVSREKYIDRLNKLMDSGVIKDFTDKCSKKGFEFDISVTREIGQKLEKKKTSAWAPFKLQRNLNQRLNCITENNKLKQFGSPEEIIEYFVDFRLKLMGERKIRAIERLTEDLAFARAKIEFIWRVRENRFSLANFKNKSDMRESLEKLKLGKQFSDRLLAIPTYSFTQDEIDKLNEMCNNIEGEIAYYEKVSEKELYINDLDALEAQLL